MRYSLLALVVFVLWIAAAVASWTGRQSWTELSQTEASALAGLPRDPVAPDQRRVLCGSFSKTAEILERGEGGVLLWSNPVRGYECRYGGFVDDNNIVIEIYDIEATGFLEWRLIAKEVVAFRRRHPEWWWGHFYRPEVWVFVLLSGVLLVMLFRRVTHKRAVSP